ncbi:dynamin family protein [Gillisia sp. Hel_I_29]|uniref:dynamin family protein n=1 Tax=Gillisia sp. Hel_I_29 TaxID=1249975 RepID=UPI000550A182|nr:dynamin family protein [Gillisia sp. Hel_I_29]
MNIEINYNTISFESQINCSDKTIQNNLEQTIEDIKNKRITDWFGTFINRLKEESNNDPFSIEINGCDLYEKVLIDSILDRQNGLIDQKKINVIDDKWVNRNYNNIDAFLNFALNSNEEIVKKAIKPNVENIKTLRSNKVEVPVIATMSSGKSTLLNALIGQDFLFEDTGAATATTCNIKINNKLEKFIAQAIDKETILEESQSDISAFLSKWNSNANKNNFSNLKLNLEGPVKNLNSSSLELNFIDTPGPNSAQYSNHTKKTFTYLKDNQQLPIVLYVLDPEKMDSKDDDNTLREISDVLKSNKQNLDRIIFIYNKVDREELDKKAFSEISPKIKQFLGRYNIENPKVFPLSAKYAKLAQLNSNLSRNEKNKLNVYRNDFIPEPQEKYLGYQLLEYTPISINQKQQLQEKILKSELDADLVYSGLASIKLYIEDYITNHHQKKQYKDLMSVAQNVSNVIENKILLEKHRLEEKTLEEQKKNEERTKKEIEKLNNKRTEALKEINKIVLEKEFINETGKKVDKMFARLKAESGKQELNPLQAKELVDEANKTIINLRVSIETDLISKMNDEGEGYLLKLKNEVVNKFKLDEPILETKTFNAELLNKINVLSFDEIDNYKIVKTEKKIREKVKEVTSTSWYKRIFGITDTVTYNVTYKERTEVIDGGKFYNEVINPLSKHFRKIVQDSKDEFDKMFRAYNDSFKNLVYHSFEETINSVFQKSERVLVLTIEAKNYQLQKFDKITNEISILKTPESNEKIHRKPAITY